MDRHQQIKIKAVLSAIRTKEHKMNKELLREFAYDLLDLLEENERLQEENKELRKYKKQRTKEDAEYLQMQQDTLTNVLTMLVEKK